MTAMLPRIALALAFVSPGCAAIDAPQKPPNARDAIEAVVRDATEAVISGDEARFLRAHVQKGDLTPDGNSWITTAAGGRIPDAAWDDELRAAFRQARADLQRVSNTASGLEFREIRDLETGTHGMRDAEWIGRVSAVVEGGGRSYLLRYDTGMLSARGWVLTGNPKIAVSML